MISNDYVFGDKGYEFAVRNLKSTLFDIVASENSKLSVVEAKIETEFDEEKKAALAQICEEKNECLRKILEISGALSESLIRLDSYSKELNKLEDTNLREMITSLGDKNIEAAYQQDLRLGSKQRDAIAQEMIDAAGKLDSTEYPQQDIIADIKTVQEGVEPAQQGAETSIEVASDGDSKSYSEERNLGNDVSADFKDSSLIGEEIPVTVEPAVSQESADISLDTGIVDGNVVAAASVVQGEMADEQSVIPAINPISDGTSTFDSSAGEIDLPAIDSDMGITPAGDGQPIPPLTPTVDVSLDRMEQIVSNQVALAQENQSLVKEADASVIERLKFMRVNAGVTRAILTAKKQITNLRNSRETMKALFKVRRSVAEIPIAKKTVEAVNDAIASQQVTEQQLIENGLLEPADVNKQMKIEEMLETANALYREGKVAEAKVMYDKISDLNKESQSVSKVAK